MAVGVSVQASDPAPSDLLALARKLRAGAPELRALGLPRIVRALCAAALRLRGNDKLAVATRQQLVRTTGLHPAMVEWGLVTTLASVEPEALLELAAPLWAAPHAAPAQPARQLPAQLVSVVLAGNVFTTCVRALFLPLLTGAPVLAKASTHDPVLAGALARALIAADHQVGRHLALLQFDRTHEPALRALVAEADVVSVYGSDATAQAVSALAGAARVVAHGHGISAAYVAGESLDTPTSVRDSARKLALDLCAYDQLGCLSPHFVYVQAGAAADADAFARVLCEQALQETQALLPRGQIDLAAQAAELQWRGSAGALGKLYLGHGRAVSVEQGAPRPSPGYRNIAVHPCAGPSELVHALAPLLPQLKCVGVAGSTQLRVQLAAATLTATSTSTPQPLFCRLGEMQTPSFDTPSDGRPALYGLTTRA